MDKMREEFEAWFKAEKASLVDVKYQFLTKEIMFEGWQASRAALCVELPDLSMYENDGEWGDGYSCAVSDLKGELNQIGVTCK